jgi:hypothetical protein
MGSKVLRNVQKILKATSGRLFGRVTSGTGRAEELTPADVRTLLEVATTTQIAAAYQPIGSYQETLVSGTNIKTVNSTSLLGSGDIVVSASPAGSSGQMQWNSSGAFAGAAAVVYATTGTHVIVTAQGSTIIPLEITGAANQTAALQRWNTPSNANNNGYVLQVLPAASSGVGYNGVVRLGRNASIIVDSTQFANTPAISSSNSPNAAGLSFVGDTAIFVHGSGTRLTFASSGITWADGSNLIFGTSTGSKIGTSTTQKIGFWNATPVAQQVLATGAGRTVDDVITLLQTLGLCRQS